jgi:hypothetical protein
MSVSLVAAANAKHPVAAVVRAVVDAIPSLARP